MTKLITAVSVLQLVERDLVTLDEDIRHHIPALYQLEILKGFDENEQPVLEKNTRPITLRYV